MTSKGLIDVPIEVIEYKDGAAVGGRLTTYFNHNGIYLPSEVYSLKKQAGVAVTAFNGATVGAAYIQPAAVRFTRYSDKGNLLEYLENGTTPVAYGWDSKEEYPVGEFRNITYDQVRSVFGSNTLSANFINMYRDRDGFKDGSIRTFTQTHGVGLTWYTDASGRTVRYAYDAAGRLSQVRNHGNQVIEDYLYNFAK